jgi:hypothetical protein
MKLSILALLAGTALAVPQYYPAGMSPYRPRPSARDGGPITDIVEGVGSAVGGIFGGLLDGADAVAGTAVDLIGDLLSIPGDLLSAIGLKRQWTEKDTEEIKAMRAALAPVIEKYHGAQN